MTFLPKKYEVPEKPGNYMKLDQGENRIRILSDPILGREWWVRENGDIKTRNENFIKGDRPERVRMDEDLSPDEFDASRHFWAMIVWNYKLEVVQILEITQSTIQKPLTALVKSEGWGGSKRN